MHLNTSLTDRVCVCACIILMTPECVCVCVCMHVYVFFPGVKLWGAYEKGERFYKPEFQKNKQLESKPFDNKI